MISKICYLSFNEFPSYSNLHILEIFSKIISGFRFREMKRMDLIMEDLRRGILVSRWYS